MIEEICSCEKDDDEERVDNKKLETQAVDSPCDAHRSAQNDGLEDIARLPVYPSEESGMMVLIDVG